MSDTVLLLENDKEFAARIQGALLREGFEVVRCRDVEGALKDCSVRRNGIILADYSFAGEEGTTLLLKLSDRKAQLPTVMMTSRHTARRAILASRLGAYDYWLKPTTAEKLEERLPELIETLRKAIRQCQRRAASLSKKPGGEAKEPAGAQGPIVGKTRIIQEVLKTIGRISDTDVTVLIRGETGTGKELVARAIHAKSRRAAKPFVVVNAAAIPATLLENELFGHERGSYTNAQSRRIGRFEQAAGGTLFLDEIGDMSMELQHKLLRVLQEGTFERLGGRESIRMDVRLITATNRDLEAAVRERKFREDLYFRLNVATILLPPLLQRSGDIPRLYEYFWRCNAAEFGCTAEADLSPECLALLEKHTWPGNIRELRNLVRKVLLLSGNYPVTEEIIEAALQELSPPQNEQARSFPETISALLEEAREGKASNLHKTVEEMVDRELFSQAIKIVKGDKTALADLLGVSRPTAVERLRKLGLASA